MFYLNVDKSLYFYTDSWVKLGAVTTVAGREGAVSLTVVDVEGAFASNMVGVAGGAASLTALGQVPIEQIDGYTKAETDLKVLNATNAQYTATPYDIASAIVNKPSGSAKCLRYVAPRQFSVPANLVGSVIKALTVSKSTAIFSMYKNDTQIGTITFAAGVANATFVVSATTFGLGDVLSIIAPPVQDEKLSDIVITIAARL